MKNKYDTLLWGCSIIAVGVLFLLNLLGVITLNVWEYTVPIFITVLGVSIIINNAKNIWGYVFIALGIVLFIRKAFNITIDIKYIIAILIIFAGVYLIFSMFIDKKEFTNIAGKANQFTLFGGREEKINNPEYAGTKAVCIFGGHEIDLRGLNFTHNVEILALVVFGGVTVFLPQNVNVVVKSLPIFGGTENKTNNTENNPYTVYIKATAIFGGIEIKN